GVGPVVDEIRLGRGAVAVIFLGEAVQGVELVAGADAARIGAADEVAGGGVGGGAGGVAVVAVAPSTALGVRGSEQSREVVVGEGALLGALVHLEKVPERVVLVGGEKAGGGEVEAAARRGIAGCVGGAGDLADRAQLAEAVDLGNAGHARGAVAFVLGFGGGASVGGENRRAVAVGGDGGPAEGIELEAVAGFVADRGTDAGGGGVGIADEALFAGAVVASVHPRPDAGGGLRRAQSRAAEAIKIVEVIHPDVGALQTLGLDGRRGIGERGLAAVGEIDLGEPVPAVAVGVAGDVAVLVGVAGHGAAGVVPGVLVGVAEGVGDGRGVGVEAVAVVERGGRAGGILRGEAVAVGVHGIIGFQEVRSGYPVFV